MVYWHIQKGMSEGIFTEYRQGRVRGLSRGGGLGGVLEEQLVVVVIVGRFLHDTTKVFLSNFFVVFLTHLVKC